MKIRILILSIAVACLSATPTMAATFGDGGVALQKVFNDITLLPNPGVSSVNVLTDNMSDTGDSYWSITGTGGSVATIIIEMAGYSNSNTFGIYDASNKLNTVQIFSGPQGTGAQATVSIYADGSIYLNHVDTTIDFASGNTFGFYLDATVGNADSRAIFYSDTSLNADSLDHMYAYQGKNVDTIQILPLAAGKWTDNEYALAWEDILGGGDKDFDDFVVMVESVVPVPGAILLGILGLGAAGLKLRKYT